MKASSNIALTFTGLAVKTYMLIAIVWSKSRETGNALVQVAKTAPRPSAALLPSSK